MMERRYEFALVESCSRSSSLISQNRRRSLDSPPIDVGRYTKSHGGGSCEERKRQRLSGMERNGVGNVTQEDDGSSTELQGKTIVTTLLRVSQNESLIARV